MLRKLLKHEFRATGRIMLPLFGILLLVFGLEKCLDEVEREIDRKPGWLRIPLRGILEVVRMEEGARPR